MANQLEQANNPLDGNCCLLDSMMSDPSFFKDKTDICAAYIKSSRILEVCILLSLQCLVSSI